MNICEKAPFPISSFAEAEGSKLERTVEDSILDEPSSTPQRYLLLLLRPTRKQIFF
jgi:hypothetical protein